MATKNKLEKVRYLNWKIRNCKNCELWKTRNQALVGEGNPNSRLMLIAQAPGYKEDKEGKMFIGPSGKVLDELLRIAGIDRKEVYITNMIKCMLPKYRRPRQDEIEICTEYLDEEIELIKPVVICPLGYYAIEYIFKKYAILLPSKHEFHTIYGKIFSFGDGKILPLQHPAAILYKNFIKERIIINYRKMKVLLTNCN